MAVNFKDASDFKGRTVNENLYNQVKNMDAIAGANDINVSIHFNAFNKTATGAEVWYYLGDAVGYAIAKKLSAAMANALGIADRGAKATTNLYVISQSVGHTVLAEICFIDNASDIQKYQANKQKLFKAMSDTFTSFSQYHFRTSHGGHYGLNMMDPGAVGNGYKEAVLAQEINQYLLRGQAPSEPTTNSFNIDNYHTSKFAMIRLVINDYAYKEPALINRAGEIVKKGTILTVVDLVYSGQYPRFKLKSGLYISTKKTIVEEYKQGTATTPPTISSPTPQPTQSAGWIKENGTYTLSQATYLRTGATTSASSLGLISAGSEIKYDAFCHLGGYVWIRQPRGNGYGYMATGYSKNGKRQDYWGTFK